MNQTFQLGDSSLHRFHTSTISRNKQNKKCTIVHRKGPQEDQKIPIEGLGSKNLLPSEGAVSYIRTRGRMVCTFNKFNFNLIDVNMGINLLIKHRSQTAYRLLHNKDHQGKVLNTLSIGKTLYLQLSTFRQS